MVFILFNMKIVFTIFMLKTCYSSILTWKKNSLLSIPKLLFLKILNSSFKTSNSKNERTKINRTLFDIPRKPQQQQRGRAELSDHQYIFEFCECNICVKSRAFCLSRHPLTYWQFTSQLNRVRSCVSLPVTV